MNRRKKQIELMKQSIYLRSIKLNDKLDKSKDKVTEITNLQDDKYKRYLFYKGLNDAMSRR